MSIVFEAVVVVILIIGGAYGFTWLYQRNRALTAAKELPSIETTSPAAAVRRYRQLQESVRLFHEILQHDENLPFLREDTRNAIQALLNDYYGKRRRKDHG